MEHLAIHETICDANRAMHAKRKKRIDSKNKEMYSKLINFEKAFKKGGAEKLNERVWIICYDDKLVTKVLYGFRPEKCLPRKPNCTEPCYLDPKNHPPLPEKECFFPFIKKSKIEKEKSKRRSLRLKSKKKQNEQKYDDDGDVQMENI